jgi:hypothetical protein
MSWTLHLILITIYKIQCSKSVKIRHTGPLAKCCKVHDFSLVVILTVLLPFCFIYFSTIGIFRERVQRNTSQSQNRFENVRCFFRIRNPDAWTYSSCRMVIASIEKLVPNMNDSIRSDPKICSQHFHPYTFVSDVNPYIAPAVEGTKGER